MSSRSNLEFASFSHVLHTFERLVFLKKKGFDFIHMAQHRTGLEDNIFEHMKAILEDVNTRWNVLALGGT